eukprot:scaffold5213_cov113-Isochrysis_galbana.AAC.5
MLPPPHDFNRQLKQDVHHLLWTKEPDFDPTGKGTPTTAKPWINKHAIHNPKRSNKHAPNLGLGLIAWESHCSALRIKWILNYLNATRGPWKSVLDAWLARPEMGRASICTSTHSSIPTHQSKRHKTEPPPLLGGGSQGPSWPHIACMCLQGSRSRFLTPPKGVWEGPRALVHLPRNTRCRFLFPPPCAFLASEKNLVQKCETSAWANRAPPDSLYSHTQARPV